ncbi:MAG TPA: DRTGG domain-containing protein, partial [bacterium]|nr:DRTGG domain-containing protein [bacterium]
TLTSQTMGELYGGGQFDAKAKIQKAFAKVSADKEVMLVSGFGGFAGGCCTGYSQFDAMRDLGCKALIVERYSTGERDLIDRVMGIKRLAGEGLLGVVLNMIPECKLELFRSKVVPFLKSKGIETFGIIPEDPVLHSVSVREIAAQLCGKVLCCEEELDHLVERAIVGAMNVDSALKYFRKINNKAVVTGGDRGDIQLAAMETSTRCLILTGDLYPHQNIMTVAVEKKIPIIVVPYDTLTTIDRFEAVLGHVGLRDDNKIDRALAIVSNCIDFRPIEAYVK